MKHRLHYLVACGAILLAACSSTTSIRVTPTIEPYQAPDPQFGYIAGTFTFPANAGRFAFALVNTETGAEQMLPVGEIHYLQVEQKESLRMIPVPPGKYRLAYWMAYDELDRRVHTFNFPAGALGATLFEVPAGRIAFIGNFTMAGKGSKDLLFLVPVHLRRIEQLPISITDARKSLTAIHPDFLKLTFSCIPCTQDKATAR
jgi:hypothetical protein